MTSRERVIAAIEFRSPIVGGRDGGLIHRGELSPEWPWENIRAMYEAFAAQGAQRN